MKFWSGLFLVLSCLVVGSVAPAASVLAKCLDGERSMTVVELANGDLKGKFVGFDQTLLMDCGFIRNTKTLKCISGEYYVIMFKNRQGRMVTQLNLAGDFGSDSGYLYSLNCQ